MNESQVFELDKECVHSRRYKSTDPDYPIQSVYVNRNYADGKDSVVITIDTISHATAEDLAGE